MLVLLGPTASGKTRLAVQVAHRLGGEIISADSRQVYRGMDIGTGKDLADYRIDGALVPHHLIDIVEAGADYNVFAFQQDFYTALADIRRRNRVPVICGGTGLYLDAVLQGHQFTAIPVDETARQALQQLPDEALRRLFDATPSAYTPRADTSTRKRLIRAIEIARYLTQHPDAATTPTPALPPFVVFGLNPPVELRRERISRRLHERLENGMIDEVKRLLQATAVTTLAFPVAPFFVLGTYYAAGKYFYTHRRSHLSPEWAKKRIPWHYDHHMNTNQDANWCVTKPWFDYIMGTRVIADPAHAETNPLGIRLPAFVEKRVNAVARKLLPHAFERLEENRVNEARNRMKGIDQAIPDVAGKAA